MKILIDGDGSPVKQEAISVAMLYDIPVVIVTSIAHYTSQPDNPLVTIHYVEKGPDSADYEIFKLTNKGDVVITQDYGLASLLLNKAYVIHHNGKEYHKNSIDTLLTQRFLSQKERLKGHHTTGPRQFTQKDRDYFTNQLNQLIERILLTNKQ